MRNKLSDSLGAYLAERGDYEAAALHLRPLLVEGAIPEKVRLSNMLVDAAYRAYQNGSYPDSIGRLEQANSYSETGFLFHTWGVIERDEGSFSVARDRFRKAVQLEQGRLATWRSWGTMEQRLENFERAIECFERAVELPGADAQDHHRLGVCYSRHGTTLDNTADRRGFFEKAAVHLKAGFYGNPVGYRERHHNVVNSHALALTLQRVGDRDGAISACRVGLALEPGNIRLRRLVDSL